MMDRPSSHPTLRQVARINPVVTDDAMGLASAAEAQLAAIIATSTNTARERQPRTRSRRAFVLACVMLALLAAAAIASTDPFGFWRSASPGAARFAIDDSRTVVTPAARSVECTIDGSRVNCRPHGRGRVYRRVDAVAPLDPVSAHLSRATLTAALAAAEPSRTIGPVATARLRADLATVPDEFFVHLRELVRFRMFATSAVSASRAGPQLIPPTGVPQLIACEPSVSGLACRDLNADTSVPVGAAIYAALPAPDWRPASARETASLWTQLVATVFQRKLTSAERRVLSTVVSVAAR